jgi:hypothetical protein
MRQHRQWLLHSRPVRSHGRNQRGYARRRPRRTGSDSRRPLVLSRRSDPLYSGRRDIQRRRRIQVDHSHHLPAGQRGSANRQPRSGRAPAGFPSILRWRALPLLAARPSCRHTRHEPCYVPARHSSSRFRRSGAAIPPDLYAPHRIIFCPLRGARLGRGAASIGGVESDNGGLHRKPHRVVQRTRGIGPRRGTSRRRKLRLVDNIETVAARLGQWYSPRIENTTIFGEMLDRQRRLFAMLYPDPPTHSL